MKTLILLFALATLLSMPGLAQTVTDYDGNVYNTVVIGSQRWMVQNLRTVHLSDGTPITNAVTSFNSENPLYCWYNNDSATNSDPYGALYNWYAANTGILCPTGWHVPTDEDWATLSTQLGGDNVSGGALKEAGTTHWNSPNNGATNISGFTALPGGQRDKSNGVLFNWIGLTGIYWSTTLYIEGYAWYRGFSHLDATTSRGAMNCKTGISVRCIDNSTVGLEESIQNSLEIFPNPTRNFLTICGSEIQNSELSIISTTGQIVSKYKITGQTFTIDIAALAVGIYFVRINSDLGTMQQKFFKQ